MRFFKALGTPDVSEPIRVVEVVTLFLLMILWWIGG